MAEQLKNSDVVALIDDVEKEDLYRGQVGTVVEILDENHYEIEFIDKEGKTYAQCAIPFKKLMRLQYEPAA